MAVVTPLSPRLAARQAGLGTAHIITFPLQDLRALLRTKSLSPEGNLALGDKLGLGSKTLEQNGIGPGVGALITTALVESFEIVPVQQHIETHTGCYG